MSGGEIEGSDLKLLLMSIDASNKSTTDCLKQLTESISEIKEYIIHNDYRHASTESDVKKIKKDLVTILEVLEDRKPMWSAFKHSKWVIGALIMGVLAAAGSGIYNYIFKPQPAINQQKEKPKPAPKPVTKDLIE